MKNRIVIITMVSIIFGMSCSNSKVYEVDDNYNLSSEDSAYVERELISYKNCLFSTLYNQSLEETYKRKEIQICDTNLKDLTYYFYSGFNPKWMLDDVNREKLHRKWLDKKVYIPIAQPPDHPDGSLDLARALDFYESEDLENYIDSLRKSEYKRISDINNEGNSSN